MQAYYDKYIEPNMEHICPNCGNPTSFKSLDQGYNTYCSVACFWKSKTKDPKTVEKRKKTCLEKYGVEQFLSSDKVKRECTAESVAKIKATKLERYGDEKYNNTEKFKKTCLEKYGKSNIPRKKLKYGRIFFDSSWEIAYYIWLKDKGIDFVYQPEEHFTYELNGNIHEYYPDFKVGNEFVELKGPHFFEENKMICPFDRSLDELYEKKHQCMLKNGVKIITNCEEQISYVSEKYGSDFLDSLKVENTRENIVNKKIAELMKNRGIPNDFYPSVIDYNKPENTFKAIMSNAGLDYDKLVRDTIANMPSDYPYPVYSEEKLVKEYRSLCDNKSKNLIDNAGQHIIRHFNHSIWGAKKGNCLSPVEAWSKPDLMEKVIKNRIIYSKDLSPSKIAEGFNIAKIAPKVSVFRAGTARYLVNEYLSEFEEVFDPFAGFCGRMLGVCSLGKKYIGQDINQEHIDELRNCSSFLNLNTELRCEDVFKSSGKYQCLFTCSPYNLKEVWNDNETDLSCDEWIDVCLKNFQCEKYMFIVDKTTKYKENIAKTIKNTSHFGEGAEHILIF